MSVQNKFKVGDKVKYVGSGWGEAFERGVAYPVTEIWSRGCDVDGQPVSHLFYDDFEIVEDAPKAQDNSWYEDGELPHVGTVCEVDWCGEWHSCEIIAHFMQAAGMVAAFTVNNGRGVKSLGAFQAGCFRPMQTDEDIAEEERQNTIKKMLEIIKGSCALFDAERAKVEALYAAGLRFIGDEK